MLWDLSSRHAGGLGALRRAARPVSHVTTAFLACVCELLKAEGKKALLRVWDNASGYASAGSPRLDSCAEPPGQAGGRGANPGLPVAGQESVAESHRAEVGPCQAGGRRARSSLAQSGSPRADGCLLQLQVRRASTSDCKKRRAKLHQLR
jgi:hypothetical protein